MASQPAAKIRCTNSLVKPRSVLYVELEPERLACQRADLFISDGRERRSDKSGFAEIGTADGFEFAFRMDEFVIAGGGEENGEGMFAAEEAQLECRCG